MPTAAGCAGRRARLWRSLPRDCDGLVIADPHHLAYLAGYSPPPYTFRTANSSAFLVLGPDRATLIGDNLHRPFLDAAHVDEVVAPVWYEGKATAPPRREFVLRAARDVLAATGARRIGAELAALPVGLVEGLVTPGIDLCEIAPTILECRRSKDPDEVEAIRRSVGAGEAGIAAALAEIRPGHTEFDAFRVIEQAARAAAGERALLYGDFVSGSDAPTRLGPPTDRVLRPGDLFLMDFSVVLDGYRGDLAYTMVVGGPPSAEVRERIDGCLAALEVGEQSLRPGAPCRAIDAAIRAAFADRGLDGRRDGHNGHGIGLDHPEAPYIVRESTETLRAGDVVTLEPGQYGGFGAIRFERNYLITETGFEPLSPRIRALSRAGLGLS